MGTALLPLISACSGHREVTPSSVSDLVTMPLSDDAALLFLCSHQEQPPPTVLPQALRWPMQIYSLKWSSPTMHKQRSASLEAILCCCRWSARLLSPRGGGEGGQ